MRHTARMSEKESTLPVAVQANGEFDFHEVSKWYSPSRLDGVRRKAGRANIAVDDAFDLIGGTPRLALWAHNNPGEFFTKIYARTLQTAQQTEHSGEITIRSAIPVSPLDGEYTDISDE